MKWNKLIYLISMFSFQRVCVALEIPHLSGSDLKQLGQTFFKRECGSDLQKLVWWNKGETFPSLGIGHFIWYPKDAKQLYQETFPGLVQFLVKKNVIVPEWLKSACPWKDKAELDRDARKNELQQLLTTTMDLQAAFVVDRFYQELSTAMKNLNKKNIDTITQLAMSPQGLFAMIDYAHFKGFGNNSKEQYNGYGWGLFDVVANMNNTSIQGFQESARTLLKRRVVHAPKEKKEHEQRWLIGWIKRIDQYT